MRRTGISLCATLLLLAIATDTSAAFRQFPIPTPKSFVFGLAVGPDGALWFTERNGNKIGRITTSGVMTEFEIPTPNSYPNEIAAGPDGAMWFTERDALQIGRISMEGAISEFGNPSDPLISPMWITSGPDGALWFTDWRPGIGVAVGRIGRITTSGVVTHYDLAADDNAPAQGITKTDTGEVWFAGNTCHLGRIDPSGAVEEVPVPSKQACGLVAIAAAHHEPALWFTDVTNASISRFDIGGGFTQYRLPGFFPVINRVTVDSNDTVWFTAWIEFAYHESVLGRIAGGEGMLFDLPLYAGPQSVVVAPDGFVWFADSERNMIVQFVMPPYTPTLPRHRAAQH